MRVGVRPESPIELVGAIAGRLGVRAGQIPAPIFAELEGFFERAGFEHVRSRRHVTVPGVVVVTGRGPEEGNG